MIVGSAYMIISYASDILTSIVDFVTTNDFTKLKDCGIAAPTQFNKIKADLTTLILPFLYLGIPGVLLLLSALMFVAGFYYYRAKMDDESAKHQNLEREMVHKIVKKMNVQKPPTRGMPKEEEEPETEESTEQEWEEEEVPQVKKRK